MTLHASISDRLAASFSPSDNRASAIPIHAITAKQYPNWLQRQPEAWQRWLRFQQFAGNSNNFICLPALTDNASGGVIAILDSQDTALPEVFGKMAQRLPAGSAGDEYHYLPASSQHPTVAAAALAWGLGGYYFDYKTQRADEPQANEPQANEPQANEPQASDPQANVPQVRAINAQSTTRARLQAAVPPLLPDFYFARDLINLPANLLSPQQMFTMVSERATAAMRVTKFTGTRLQREFPLVAAVAAAGREPIVFELLHNSEKKRQKLPSLTIIGKGVTFDSGGLNIKPDRAMQLMKKDMGGAAHAVCLFFALAALNLPIQLRLLVAACDNSISSASFRPGDVFHARNGSSVEITNTDAEGRLLLADLISFASEQQPDLIIDFATLTGAARVALGPDIPNLFSNSDSWADKIKRHGRQTNDLIWPMPLYQGYRKYNHSKLADIANSPTTGYGGAITAALFLQHFLAPRIDWIHIDVMAWRTTKQPLAPIGGDLQGVRAMLAALQQHYT